MSSRQPPMLGLVSPANPARSCQMVPLYFPTIMRSKNESSGSQVNCATSHSPLSFKSSLVTGLGRCIRGGGGDDDPWCNCCSLEYNDVLGDNEMEADNHDVINARDATPEELLVIPFTFIAQQPDTGTPLSLQPSMCVCGPLIEMMARTPTKGTVIMKSSSEIEIPGEKPSFHFIHVSHIDAASTAAPKYYEYAHDDSYMGPGGPMSRIKKLENSNDDQGVSQSVHSWSESVYFQEFLAPSASELSNGELFKTPFTSYGFVSVPAR